MTSNNQFGILEEVFYAFEEIIKRFYPKLNITGKGYAGPEFHYDLSKRFKDYKDTPYYFNDSLDLIHWTSLQNLSSIINNNELRLYDLNNSEDINEFNYAANILSLSKHQIKSIKRNYFAASFCRLEELHNPFLWNKYGKQYKGVAIHFTLENNLDDWETFFLSQVYYELPLDFQEFYSAIEELKQNYSYGPQFNFDLWRFAGFYKTKPFEDEKEIRLACAFPFKDFKESYEYSRKELKIEQDRNRIVNYIPLKLWSDPDSSHLKVLDIDPKMYLDLGYNLPTLPKLKINAIHFGEKCGLEKNEYWSMHSELKELFEWRLGYSIDLPLNMFEEKSNIT